MLLELWKKEGLILFQNILAITLCWDRNKGPGLPIFAISLPDITYY